jgi:hypothetical protein
MSSNGPPPKRNTPMYIPTSTPPPVKTVYVNNTGCDKCNGVGKIQIYVKSIDNLPIYYWLTCDECSGYGHL